MSKNSNKKRSRKPTRGPSGRAGPRGHKSAGRNDKDPLLLFGVHTVRAALQNEDRKKSKLWLTENALRRVESLLQDVQLDVDVVAPQILDKLVGPEAVHQGLVLRCDPLEQLDASELFHLADKKLLVVLDQVTDPHNAGAIMRSASALGADAMITTTRNTVRETAVLAKSACGALDTIRMIELRNLSKGIGELNEMGFTSIGLDSEGPLKLEDTLTSDKANQVALVLGAENRGLRQQTREACTHLARLDMPGPIKSLNVSNAATLALYATRRYFEISSR